MLDSNFKISDGQLSQFWKTAREEQTTNVGKLLDLLDKAIKSDNKVCERLLLSLSEGPMLIRHLKMALPAVE